MHLLTLLVLFIAKAAASVSFTMSIGDLTLNQLFNITWTTDTAPIDLTLEKMVNGSLFGSVIAKNVERDWFMWKPTAALKDGEYIFKVVDSSGSSDMSAAFEVALSTVSTLSLSSSSSSSSFSSSSSYSFSASPSSPSSSASSPSSTQSSTLSSSTLIATSSLSSYSITATTSPSSTPTSSSLSPVAIIGIVVAICGALVLAVALFFFCRLRKIAHDLEATSPVAPLPHFPADISYAPSIETLESAQTTGEYALESKLHPCISESSSHYSHKDFSPTFSATTTLTQSQPESSSRRSSFVHTSRDIGPSIIDLYIGSPYDSNFPSFSSPTSSGSSPRSSIDMAASFYPEDTSALVSPLALPRRPELYTQPRNAPSPPASRTSSTISPVSSRRGSFMRGTIRSTIRSFLYPRSPTQVTEQNICMSPIDAAFVKEEKEEGQEPSSVAGCSPRSSRKRSSTYRSRYKSGNFGIHPLQMNRATVSDAGSVYESATDIETASIQQHQKISIEEAAPAVICMGRVTVHKAHRPTEQAPRVQIPGPAAAVPEAPPQSRRHMIPRRPVPSRTKNEGGWI